MSEISSFSTLTLNGSVAGWRILPSFLWMLKTLFHCLPVSVAVAKKSVLSPSLFLPRKPGLSLVLFFTNLLYFCVYMYVYMGTCRRYRRASYPQAVVSHPT